MADAPWDIAIVGCGPTGLVLATLLGQLGCRVCVLERDEEVQPVARATHIDEETLRNLQATGLMHELLPHTQPFGRFEIVDAAGRRLLRAEVASPPFVDGYDGSRYFDQPAFERILRAGLRRYPSVVLETGAAALDVEDAGSHAVVRARTPRGESEILARWVVGCDGGRSLVRRAIGSQMRSFAPRRRWLIVDTVLRDPSSARLLPDCFQYVLEERGLSIYAHGFGQNRRWELELPAAAPVPSDEEVVRWLARRVDPALLRIVRIAPYTHNASVATRWRVGRVLLAGDAAHMMPPSTGQGLCSGVRDATNLAWKLHRVVTGLADERLLDTYQQEREPHVREVLAGALFVGDRLRARTELGRWWRGVQLRALGSVPALQAFARRLAVRRPRLVGFADARCVAAGHVVPQVRVLTGGAERLLDDVVGYRFALIGLRLPDEARRRAAAVGVAALALDADVPDPGARLARWLVERELEFVVVRPDRVVFGGGRLGQLPAVLAEVARPAPAEARPFARARAFR